MNKKQALLEAALDLFTEQGVGETTTKKITLAAEVSEGLLFKHFASKQGLVNALLEKANDRAFEIGEKWMRIEHPKLIIKQILSDCINIEIQDYKLLLFTLSFKKSYTLTGSETVEKINEKLIKVFRQLGAQNPETEKTLFWITLYGIISYNSHEKLKESIPVYETILGKFNV